MNKLANKLAKMSTEQIAERLLIVPSVLGGGIGSIYGVRHGYISSQNYTYKSNIETTLSGMWLGACYGTVFGCLWPVTVPVTCSVTMLRWWKK